MGDGLKVRPVVLEAGSPRGNRADAVSCLVRLDEHVDRFVHPFLNIMVLQLFDEDKDTSIVADILNRSGQFPDYVGPVNWDIVAEDWACWRQGISAEECAQRYLAETERVGGGIILMHDSSEEEVLRPQNRTMEMTKMLVPLLNACGYRFVRLDAVPQIKRALTLTAW